MADAVFSFELEGSADAALEQAAALEQLREKLVADTAALGEMNKAFRALKGSAHADTAAFKGLKDQIAAQKAAIANAHNQFLQLGGDFKKIKKPVEDSKGGFEQLFASAKRSSGPLGSLAGGLEKLKSVGASGALAAGYVAVAAAILAVAAAAVAATAALFKFGLAMADAVRAERLQLEGLTKIRNWYGLAADKAGFLQETISKVSASSALGRDQINGMAVSLYKAGLRGGSLQQALEGVATATSAAGEEQGNFYKSWFIGAARSGQATKKLADDIKARFGGVARAQLLSLDVQSRKLRESFQQLFSGLNIDSFLEAMHDVTDLFSQNTFSGRALKTILETVFQPMADFAAGYGIYFKRFFQGLVIGAQLLVLGVLRLRNWFRKTFGDSEILGGIDKQRLAVYAGAAAVGAFAAVMGVLALAVAAVVAPFIWAGVQVYRFVSAVDKAWEELKAINWSAAGKSLVDGIVNGIKNGAQWVIDAVKNLGAAAMKAFKEKLGIASPSRLFARFGVEIPRGMAVGVRAGTPAATQAVTKMADQSYAEARDVEPTAAPRLERRPYDVAPAPSLRERAGGAATLATTLGGGVKGGQTVIHLAVKVESRGREPRDVGREIGGGVIDKLREVFEGVSIELAAEAPANG